MPINIEEFFLAKRNSLLKRKDDIQNLIKFNSDEKAKFMAEVLRKAEERWDKEYGTHIIYHGKNLQDSLSEVDAELALLSCPRFHEQLEEKYYCCQLCGYVWDDRIPF